MRASVGLLVVLLATGVRAAGIPAAPEGAAPAGLMCELNSRGPRSPMTA